MEKKAHTSKRVSIIACNNVISKAQCAPHFALQKLRRSDYLSLRRKRFIVFRFLIQLVLYRVHNHIKSNLVISAFRHDDIGAFLFRLDKPFVHRFDGRKVLQNDGIEAPASFLDVADNAP